MEMLWKKFAAAGFLLYLVLFMAGFICSYTLPATEVRALEVPTLAISGSLSGGDGYRIKPNMVNNLAQLGFGQTALPQVLDQQDVQQIKVYEKTAQVSSGTTTFAEDERLLRNAVSTHKAVVFEEKAAGIAPERRLTLGVSVHPERFDALFRELNQVGYVGTVALEQKDRTGEFRKLHGQRQSLKKHQEAILKLREATNSSIDNALKLEQKILEIDKEIQTLGVQLGDLLDKEPSYNLYMTLVEYQPGSRHDRTLTLNKRLESALLWSIGWWFTAMLVLGVGAATWLSMQTLRPGRVPEGKAEEKPVQVLPG